MAVTDTKKNILLGQSVADQVKNTDDNFNTLFDNDDDLQTQINELAKGTDLTSHINNKSNPHGVTKSQVGLSNVTNDAQVKRSEMGAAGGVATLDSSGKVPSSQLPSYVDDVIEGYYYNSEFYSDSAHTTKIASEAGKIYTDLSSNKTYRWGGSSYVEISASLAIGTTSSTAAAGNHTHNVASSSSAGFMSAADKTNLDANTNARHTHSNKSVLDGTTASFTTDEKTKLAGIAAGANKYTHPSYTAKSSGLYKITVDSSGHVSATTAVAKSDITQLGIPAQDTTYSAATESANGLMSAADKKKLNAIDSSLQGVTADEIGKVKDVTVNGTSVLGDDGTASITIDDLEGEFETITSTDSRWISDGTNYLLKLPIATDTHYSLYNTALLQMVVQEQADPTSGYNVINVGTTKPSTCYLRKIKGNAVGTSGGTTTYLYSVTYEAYQATIENYSHSGSLTANMSVNFTALSNTNYGNDSSAQPYAGEFIDFVQRYGGSIPASGVIVATTGTILPICAVSTDDGSYLYITTSGGEIYRITFDKISEYRSLNTLTLSGG